MPQSDPSRTEDPTQKRIDKAREEGNVGKSEEVSKNLVILIGLVALWLYLGILGQHIKMLFHWFMDESCTLDVNKQNLYELFQFVSIEIAKMVMPILLALGLVAFIAVRTQVGPLWSPKVFNPKFDKIFNIAGGLQKIMLSMNTLVRLGKQLLQAVAIAVATYVVIKSELPNIPPLFYQTADGLVAYILEAASRMVIYALVPMLIIAAADLWYQKWDYKENLKMTKDEVKDEHRQVEGDPEIKQKQKQKMMEVMGRRMMQDVPKADVVITNPTHIAVALKYDPLETPAPVCLAKGSERVAEKIKEIARENNVPIRENKPLARALYKSVEIGEAIPEELYKAVAALLAQLHKFKHQAR